MVAHTGFEPVISALRGRCPKPLDECAAPTPKFIIYRYSSQMIYRGCHGSPVDGESRNDVLRTPETIAV